MTFIQNNYLPVADEAVLPFTFLPGTPIFAQDMLGYVFSCAATLAAGFVFTGGKLENWIKWLFILNGVLFIVPTLLIPAIPLPVNETGTGIGNQIGLYLKIHANIGGLRETDRLESWVYHCLAAPSLLILCKPI